MTTTFAMLRKAGACTDGYRRLARHLGGIKSYGSNTEINLLTILESNGIDDAIWALRATALDCDKEKRLMACDFAELVLNVFEEKCPGDKRPRLTIEAARRFANGEISECELLSARRAAVSYAAAAYPAVDANASDAAVDAYAAYAAAAYPAYAAAAYPAYAAYAASAAVDANASDAAYAAAAYAPSCKARITEIFKNYLEI